MGGDCGGCNQSSHHPGELTDISSDLGLRMGTDPSIGNIPSPAVYAITLG